MNQNNIFVLLIIVILISSCKSPNSNLYEFDPRTLKENGFTLSEIADDIYYIPLDNSIPLGYSADFTFHDTAIYFRSYNIGILCFNRNGDFIRKIGSIGRGPGEYIRYTSFSVDFETGKVYNLDLNSIEVYSSTGLFIKNIPLQEYGGGSGIEFYDSKIIVFYDIQFKNARYEWIAFDTLGSVIKKQERGSLMFTANVGAEGHPTYRFRNHISYWNNYFDTVFSILPDLSIEPVFIICQGEHRLPRSYFPFDPSLQEFFTKFMTINRIFETNQFFVIKYFYKKSTWVFVNKHNREVFLIYLEDDDSNILNKGIENDLDNGPWFFPENYFIEIDREYLVGVLYPYQIKEQVASDEFKNITPKYPEKKKEFEKMADSLKETDNPVLVMVRLKK